MINKQIIILAILLLVIPSASALHEIDNDILTVFNTSHVSYTPFSQPDIKKVVCVDCVCTRCMIDVRGWNPYEIDYVFRYAHNTTSYKESVFTIKQEVSDTYWGLQKTFVRTLAIDGIDVATYNCSSMIGLGKQNVFVFDTVDGTVKYGDVVLEEQTIAFTQCNCDEQYNYTTTTGTRDIILMELNTIEGGYDSTNNFVLSTHEVNLKLGGLTGSFLKLFRGIPLIGDSLYTILYPPFVLIQYILNFSFTFVDIIINDWWYMLLLLEILCIIPALQYKSYPDVVGHYINNHVQIITFLHHKVVLPLVNLILKIVDMIIGLIRG